MSDFDLIDAVARKTGEDFHEIRRLGFTLAGPDESSSDLEPECIFDLIDLPEAGTVDWDEVLCGCREPFYDANKRPNRKAKAEQVVRAA